MWWLIGVGFICICSALWLLVSPQKSKRPASSTRRKYAKPKPVKPSRPIDWTPLYKTFKFFGYVIFSPFFLVRWIVKSLRRSYKNQKLSEALMKTYVSPPVRRDKKHIARSARKKVVEKKKPIEE